MFVFTTIVKSATLMRTLPSLVTTQNFLVNQVITFMQLVEFVHQKINIEPHQYIEELRFRCPIFELGQPYIYTSFILRNDTNKTWHVPIMSILLSLGGFMQEFFIQIVLLGFFWIFSVHCRAGCLCSI